MLQSLDTLIAFVVILLTTSLLVTILVQMLSSAFALRGKNLGNALALTFQSIHPDIGKDAYALAERILGDPRLSDSTTTRKKIGEHAIPDQMAPWSWWSPFNGLHLASAIRPEEIYNLLKQISADADLTQATASPGAPALPAPPTKEKLGSLAKELLEKIGVPHPHNAVVTVDNDFSAILAIAGTFTNAAEKASITAAINAAQAKFKTVAVHITDDVDALTKWFDAAQDRAQQWFQTHARIFTIACGILLAFFLQLDSVEIFKFVSTNAVARAALAGSADKLVEKTEGILEKSGSLLGGIYAAENKAVGDSKLPPDILKSAVNTTLLRAEIEKALGSAAPKDFDSKYATAEKTAIDAYYKDRREQMDDLTKGVAATGFDLLPKNLGHRWENETGTWWIHFLGMLITAGLLSLGAPFWYNSLRDITSLRPALSKLIGEEKAAENKPAK
jgi:hypothetical protein